MRTKGIWALAGIVVFLGGCATTPHESPVSQRAAVHATLDQWKQAVVAKDVEATMPLISDEFTSRRFGNKQDYKRTMNGYAGEGKLDGIEIDLDSAQIQFENGVATVFPVAVKSPAGAYDLGFYLRDEGSKTWRIIGIDMGRQ